LIETNGKQTSSPTLTTEPQTSTSTEPPTSDACIVCGNTNPPAPLYHGIVRCPACGYVSADMRLTDEELCALYNEQFFTGAEFSDYAADERLFRKNFRLRFRELKKFLVPARHRRLLEIGSAYGFFLDEVRAEFESVEGIDITDVGVAHARGRFKLNVVQADFLTHDYGAQKFDVVCMWDTIEHLRAPHLYVEKIAAHTDAGALLAITTGDVASLNARVRRGQWRMIHPPTHLHYFAPETLARLLARYGFEVVYNRYCGFYRSLGNVAYNIFVLRWQRPSLFRQLERTGLTKFGFYLNLYDIMYVIARRR
jgi:2-polyprenyl-3-methyl-5-hydroxy-6-metoxy-1,4-benzoquinol methylase